MRLSNNATYLLFTAIVALLILSSSSALSDPQDSSVLLEGDVDSSPSIGTSSGVTDAQIKDGTSETITEVRSGVWHHGINSTSDIDTNADIGTHSNFGNLQAMDSVYDTFNEGAYSSATVFSLDTQSSLGYMVIGNGSVSWGRITGTISFWIRFKDLSTVYRPWGQADNFEMRTSSSRLVLDWGSSNSIISNTVFSIDTYYFIGVTWNENTNSLKLYVGTEISAPSVDATNSTWTDTLTSVPVVQNNFLASSNGVDIVSGYGDDLRFYATDRSLSDIQSDFNVAITGSEPYLRSYYKLDNSLIDYGPDSNSGSSTGFTSFDSAKTPAFPTGSRQLLNLEMQFSNLPYTTQYLDLAINTNIYSGEGLAVDYWDGFMWVPLISSITASSWNNITVDSLITSPNFFIRFRDTGGSGDTATDNWQLDSVQITYTNYKLDFEQAVSGLNTGKEYYELTIYGSSSDAESFDMQMWNASSGSWLSPLGTSISTSLQWYNMSISRNGVINSATTWRYTSKSDVKDNTQTTLSIDYSGIYSYNVLPIFSATQIDFEFEYSTSGNTVSWTAEDQNPDSYSLYRDGSLVSSGSWSNASAITFNVDSGVLGVHNYTIVVSDLYGNSITDMAWVTIVDTTNPTISSPVDFSYSEGSTSNVIIWLGIDDYAEIYEVFKNGTSYSTSTWISGNNITINIDGLSKGLYNFSIIIYDTSLNLITDFVWVNVTDETPPSISNPPADVNYEQGTTGNNISWTATDNYPDTFTIYKDGFIYFSGGWISGSPITIGIDGLSIGQYNYTIIFYDKSFNSITDAVIVSVGDTVVPVLNTPADIGMEEGSAGNDLIWVVTESNEQTYFIYRNETQVATGSYISGASIIYDLDGLSIGKYNFTILVNDISGNSASDIVWVTVSDITNPSISSPSDIFYNEGQTGFIISWTVSDTHPANYTLYKDGVIISNTTWASGTINQTVDALTLGSYNYTLFIQDTTGNTAADTVIVAVSDTNNPVIDSPSDIVYNEGITGNTITWMATDAHAGTYSITRNGSVIASGSWISGVGITINVDGLLMNAYQFIIIVQDTSGNGVSDTVLVTVSDNNAPILSSPSDSSYFEASTGNILSWDASDTHPDYMKIYRNGIVIVSSAWTSGTISINVDGLGIGIYNFTIQLNDTSGNSAIDTIMLTVTDNINPVLDSPLDQVYALDSTGHTLEWIGTDTHAANYTIYRNGSIVGTGTWISGAPITINIDGLPVGNHNYTILIQDSSANSATDQIWVSVTSESVFTSTPSDLYYIFGEVGNLLSWTAEDFNPDTYIVYNNGTEVASGTWSSGIAFTYNVDGLDFGVYNFSVFVNDTDNNFITYYSYVIVSDMPVWASNASNATIVEGTTSNTLTWNSTDMLPDTYVIYRNGTQISTGSWNNATSTTINIDGLLIGIYNFTIIVNDTVNNYITDTVWLTIIDTTNPTVIEPNAPTYSEDSTGNTLSWNASDIHSDNYIIYLNGSMIESGNWTSATNITISIDGLVKSLYNYTIIFYDTSGNSVASTIIVTVIDTTIPVIDSPADVQFSEGSSGNSITWTANDTYPLTYEILQNGSQVSTGSWNSGVGIVYSIDGLSKNVYNFTIVVTDASGNQVIDTVIVTVVDTSAPITDSPADRAITEGGTGNSIIWTATDAYAFEYEILLDGLRDQNGTWVSGVGVSYNLDSLPLGVYNLTIIFTDESGNFVADTVIITVNDETPPILNTPPDVIYSEGTSSHSITWVASEINPSSYTVYRNGTQVANGAYTNGGNIIISVDGLTKGKYNYTIIVVDSSGNNDVDIVWVTVNDTDPPLIDSPVDINMDEGQPGQQITWNASDAHPSNYTIYKNGFVVATGNWTTTITISLDGTVWGVYNFTVYIFDTSNNTNSDEVIVFVSDATPPSIDSPVDTQYVELTTGHSITWNVGDTYKDYYVIYIDGSVQVNTTWNTSTINYVIDGNSIGTYNLTIVLYDLSGNTNQDTVFFTVTDATPPGLVAYGNLTYSEGSTGYSLNWTGSDVNPGNYFIYRNGSQVDFGNWTAGVNITYSVDGLAKNAYNFTMIIYDSSGNTAVNTVWLFVIDTINPTVNSPGDVTYSEGDPGAIITWVATDVNPGNYEVYRNGSLLPGSNIYSSGGNITISVEGLLKGVYLYNIFVYDTSGNFANDSVYVTVEDITPPTLSSPDDVYYIESSTGNQITWIASDSYEYRYFVYRNGTEVDTNTWTSGAITISIDGLVIGVYYYSIIVFDQSGNFAIDLVLVYVTDSNPPQISGPADFTYIEGTTGNTIAWIPVDNYPSTYTIYLNGIFNSTGSWTNNTAILISIDGHTIGTYNYSIQLFDGSNNFVIDYVLVTVEEVTPPVFIKIDEDITFSEGDLGYNITWDLYDTYPGTYTLYKDGVAVITDTIWTNNVNITYSLDGMTKGVYTFILYVYDSSGNVNSNTVIVTVLDKTYPNVSGSAGFTFESGNTGNVIYWNVSDTYAATYDLEIDGSRIITGSVWSSGTAIERNVDLLGLGSHNLTIIVRDASGNAVINSIFVTVEDTTNPLMISGTASFTMAEGTTSTLQWTFTDVNSQTYNIYLDGTSVSSNNSWTSNSPINYPLTGLLKGVYNYSIIIYDNAGNYESHFVIVTVTDDKNPEFLSTPSDFNYTESTSGHSISWTMSDSYEGEYEYYRNGIIIENATWVSNVANTFDIDGLEAGKYNFTIYLWDASNNSISHSITVYVLDETNPEFVDDTNSFEFDEETTGNEIRWVIFDLHPAFYNITLNGNNIRNDTWLVNDTIFFNVDNLEAGDYTIVIFLVDQSGNNNTNTINFIIVDSTKPLLLSTPESFTYQLGTTGNVLLYDVYDRHPASYIMYIDDAVYIGNLWKNNQTISVNVDGLEAAYYNFTIVFIDESQNKISYSVIVRVKDPQITDTNRPEIELHDRVYAGDKEEIFGNWTTFDNQMIDNGTITVTLFYQSEIFSYNTNTTDGNFSLIFDYTGLTPGVYYWQISFSKPGFQTWDDILIKVEVIPFDFVISIDVEKELVQGEEFYIYATVSFANTTLNNSSLGLSGFIANYGAAEGVEVKFIIVLVDFDGATSVVTKNEFTNDKGIALISLTPSQTLNLVRIESISAEIAATDNNQPTGFNFSNSEIPEVQPSKPSTWDMILATILRYLFQIIVSIAVLVLFFVLLLIQERKRQAKVRLINDSIKVAYDELKAIESIQSIIIQTTTKLTLYEEIFTTDTLNTNLVGGMVTAFSSFLDEVGQSELFGFEMMERDDISLTVHKGKHSNFIVISKLKLPMIMLFQIQMVQSELERQFKSNLTNTRRGVMKLTKEQVHPIYHKMKFKIPLTQKLSLNSKNISSLMKERSISRVLKHHIQMLEEVPTAEDGMFMLRDLKDYFKSQGVEEKVSLRTTILAYDFDIIEAHTILD